MATLTVNAAAVAPSITTQPSNQSVTVGQTATFSVIATGTAPLSYQWQKNSANISGATAASYTTPATASGDNAAKFDVIVSNSAGSQTSTMETLTVNAAAVLPTIVTQPANQTVNVGQTATFSVTATGTAPLSYQWQKNSANITWRDGRELHSLPQTATKPDNGAKFDVIVSNTAGSQDEHDGDFDRERGGRGAMTITTQPTNQTDERRTNSDVCRHCDWNRAPELPVAKEQRKYYWRNGRHLHHSRNGNDRQRSEVRRNRQQHRRQPNKHDGNANGDRSQRVNNQRRHLSLRQSAHRPEPQRNDSYARECELHHLRQARRLHGRRASSTRNHALSLSGRHPERRN